MPFLRNSNDFVFDTQVIVQAVAFDFAIAEVPVTTKYFTRLVGEFRPSWSTGCKTLAVMLRYQLAHDGEAQSGDFPAVSRRSPWLNPSSTQAGRWGLRKFSRRSPTGVWILIDHSSPSWDQSHYLLNHAAVPEHALDSGGSRSTC